MFIYRLYVNLYYKSPVQVDNHGITISCHLRQCRPCTISDMSCYKWKGWKMSDMINFAVIFSLYLYKHVKKIIELQHVVSNNVAF